jgi:hypothetical protein
MLLLCQSVPAADMHLPAPPAEQGRPGRAAVPASVPEQHLPPCLAAVTAVPGSPIRQGALGRIGWPQTGQAQQTCQASAHSTQHGNINNAIEQQWFIAENCLP